MGRAWRRLLGGRRMGFGRGRGHGHRAMQVVILVVLEVLCISVIVSSSISARPIFWLWGWICDLLAVVLVLWGLGQPCR